MTFSYWEWLSGRLTRESGASSPPSSSYLPTPLQYPEPSLNLAPGRPGRGRVSFTFDAGGALGADLGLAAVVAEGAPFMIERFRITDRSGAGNLFFYMRIGPARTEGLAELAIVQQVGALEVSARVFQGRHLAATYGTPTFLVGNAELYEGPIEWYVPSGAMFEVGQFGGVNLFNAQVDLQWRQLLP